MTKNGLTYTIDNWNIKSGHIQLNAYREDGSIENTYPVTYQTNPEIDEVIEKIKKTKSGKWINDENDQPKWDVTITEEVIKVPTNKKVINPEYFNPRSLDEIEDWLVEKHEFTK